MNQVKIGKFIAEMKKNIVGGKILGYADSVEMDVCEVHKTNTDFWSTIGNEFLGATALPSWGGFFPSEDKLNLLGNLSAHLWKMNVNCQPIFLI